VEQGPLSPPDPEEPTRVAKAAQELGLSYLVITSVTRDDLPDGGASLFGKTIDEIRKIMPQVLVEVLIPDFQGTMEALQTVMDARPDVLNHNLETVPRLYPTVRPEAIYSRSLELLKRAKEFDSAIPTKSGLMLGLGESSEEIENTLQDLLAAGSSMLTLGQYLQPSKDHLAVDRFVSPEEFDDWRQKALKMGFSQVASGPFVRSSYHAKELRQALRNHRPLG
jgi:lipoic acid synthetase